MAPTFCHRCAQDQPTSWVYASVRLLLDWIQVFIIIVSYGCGRRHGVHRPELLHAAASGASHSYIHPLYHACR
jgi:hypothetical protein